MPQSLISAKEMFSIDKFDVSTWASRPLTSDLLDVLGHFLLLQSSQHTRSAYARDLLEFLNFCKTRGENIKNVGNIKEKHILIWRENLLQKHTKYENSLRRVSQSSIARKLCTLSSFLDFALKRKLIDLNPLKKIKRPKVRRQSHATVLNAEEISCVLQASQSNLAARRAQQTQGSPRDAAALALAHTEWCILVLLFTVGMRVSELCMLKIQDVSIEGDVIRLHLLAKGGRSHSPLIHPEAGKVLLEYIRTLRGCAAPDSALFPSNRNGRSNTASTLHIHRSTVFRIVKEAAHRAGIKRKFSPHGCRATLATQLHLNEVPVVEIQGLLNHAQVTTTQLYLHRIDHERESAALQLPWSQKLKLKTS